MLSHIIISLSTKENHQIQIVTRYILFIRNKILLSIYWRKFLNTNIIEVGGFTQLCN